MNNKNQIWLTLAKTKNHKPTTVTKMTKVGCAGSALDARDPTVSKAQKSQPSCNFHLNGTFKTHTQVKCALSGDDKLFGRKQTREERWDIPRRGNTTLGQGSLEGLTKLSRFDHMAVRSR